MACTAALLSLLVLLALCRISVQQSEPPTATPPLPPATPPLPPAARDFLEAHNEARAAVGVSPLTWSPSLANATSLIVRYQRNKMQCQFADLSNSKYGGNQLFARGMDVMPRMVVDRWVEEKKFYNHTDNSCAPNHMCGVYTQVVWNKSQELGCAQATCLKEQASLTICFYNPPGNVIGESPY